MYSTLSIMDREILSRLPTLLRHYLKSKMANVTALDSVQVYKHNTKSIPYFIKAFVYASAYSL